MARAAFGKAQLTKDAIEQGKTLFDTGVVGPRIQHDCGHWLFGEINASEVRLQHSANARKVISFALLLLEQARTNCSDGPPHVQITKCHLFGDWVVKDGAHRAYAALISGLPLKCKW